jgi:heme-degrading monooxygenase HmoA
MYLRFLDLRVRQGQEAAFTRFYQERVMPALGETEGCLYAGLLAPWRSETHRSLTIWATAEHASAYEASGLFHALLAECKPMLDGTSEWRVRLSRDPLETIDPDKREPPTEGYQVDAQAGGAALAHGQRLFVRIVGVRVVHGKLADFVAIYRDQVMPALESVPGCRGVFLAEAVDHPLEVLSITLWDREEDAVRYEMSGDFERLTSRLDGTFSPVYDWRTRLGDDTSRGRADVSSYQVVRGRRLAEPEDGSAPGG